MLSDHPGQHGSVGPEKKSLLTSALESEQLFLCNSSLSVVYAVSCIHWKRGQHLLCAIQWEEHTSAIADSGSSPPNFCAAAVNASLVGAKIVTRSVPVTFSMLETAARKALPAGFVYMNTYSISTIIRKVIQQCLNTAQQGV